MARGIRVSPKHGVNPSVAACHWCGGDKNEIMLIGHLPGDERAPHRAVFDMEPCDACREQMKTHVLLVAVDEKRSRDPQNPYRTGLFCWVPREIVDKQLKPPEFVASVLEKGIAYVPHDIWEQIGLPTGEEPKSAGGKDEAPA